MEMCGSPWGAHAQWHRTLPLSVTAYMPPHFVGLKRNDLVDNRFTIADDVKRGRDVAHGDWHGPELNELTRLERALKGAALVFLTAGREHHGPASVRKLV